MALIELAPGEASVTKIGTGYLGRVRTTYGYIQFFFNEVTQSRQSIEGVLEITIDVPGESHPTFVQRIDIRSSSAVDGLTTRLNNAFGGKRDERGYNWSLVLNTYISRLSLVIKNQEKAVCISEDQFSEPEFLLSPFLQKDASNLVFATSEAGKTWFVQRMVLSLVTGKEFLGFPSPSEKRTLYLDYEDSRDSFASRMHKLCKGMGVPFTDTLKYVSYYKPAGSFRQNVEVAKRMVDELSIDLIVIDAGGDAAGGSPNDEEKVLDLFNALEEIPCTKLMLHHEPKYVQSEAAAFYGSMYWKARSRVAWRIEVESEEADSKLLKLSIQKKSNLPPQQNILYRQHFAGVTIEDVYDGPLPHIPSIIFTKEEVEQQYGTLGNDEKIVKALEDNRGELRHGQIVDITKIPKATITRRLEVLQNKGLIKVVAKGASTLYKLT